jgi:hypothetical protein
MSTPPSYLELDDYLHGVISDAEATELEERLFAAAQTGDDEAARFLDKLQRRATWLADEGQFGEAYTRAEVDALLAREANVIHRYEVESQGTTEVSAWKSGIKRVIVKLNIDLRGYEHVEVLARSRSGDPIITFRDIAPDPTDGCLYAVCMEPVARMAFEFDRNLAWELTAQRDGKREKIAQWSTKVVGEFAPR